MTNRKKIIQEFKSELKRGFTTRTSGKTFIDVMEIYIILEIAKWVIKLF